MAHDSQIIVRAKEKLKLSNAGPFQSQASSTKPQAHSFTPGPSLSLRPDPPAIKEGSRLGLQIRQCHADCCMISMLYPTIFVMFDYQKLYF